jgi:hypothetical protein
METARVDIRKLQLLNDRINQTIDALNQVRFSVHGVQTGVNAVTGLGLGHTAPTVNPYFANPFLAQQITNPYLAQQAWGMGVNPFTNFANGFANGLGHTSPETIDPTFAYGRIAQTFPFAPWAYSPFGQAYTPFASGIY